MSAPSNPVGWFEIPVADMDRAKAFYEYLFSVELEDHEMGPAQMSWFPMHMDAPGAAGTLIKGDGYVPSETGVLVYFSAPDLDATVAKAKEKGGHVLAERFPIGEHGFIAMIRDSEGNRIGLHSMN